MFQMVFKKKFKSLNIVVNMELFWKALITESLLVSHLSDNSFEGSRDAGPIAFGIISISMVNNKEKWEKKV